MNIKSLLAILMTGLLASCSAPPPKPVTAANDASNRPARTQDVVAVAGDPCFHKGTIYSDGAAACQAGVQYRCNNGEWVSLSSACTEGSVAVSRPCQFEGITFATGAASCQAGTQYRCEDGAWRSLGISCLGESPKRIAPDGRTCMFNDVTVATSSTVCRSGTTFLCNDGEWVNLGTLCR